MVHCPHQREAATTQRYQFNPPFLLQLAALMVFAGFTVHTEGGTGTGAEVCAAKASTTRQARA